MAFEKYPARAHALKVAKELAKLIGQKNGSTKHAVLLQAPPVLSRHDTDRELPYHQEANFMYLTGVPSADATVLITFDTSSSGDVDSVHHQLLVPPADPDVTMWSVAPPTLDEAKATYDSDSYEPTTALAGALKSLAGDKAVLHTLTLTMENPALPAAALDLIQKGDGSLQHSSEHLLTALHRARLTKDEHEINLIREANSISSNAHEVLMRELGRHAKRRQTAAEGSNQQGRSGKEGLRDWEVEGEQDAEALFVATCKRMGANQAYLPIVASGSRASTLHYVCNDRLFPSTSTPRKAGDTSFSPPPMAQGCCSSPAGHNHSMPVGQYHSEAFEPQVLLIDAGCEWDNHASDITRTIPVGNGGKYTAEAAEIYELVLRMQKETEAMVRPGTHWDTIHLHAHKVLINGFLKLGIFSGDADAILQSGVTAAFFPHGLGHSLGLDVHDSRQYLKTVHTDLPAETKSTPAKLYAYLRIRQPLLENMVLTVEPGCYFAPQLLETHGAWTSEFVNKEKLEKYAKVGGVRIEDVVVVRGDKCENLTTAVRERADIERLCSGTE